MVCYYGKTNWGFKASGGFIDLAPEFEEFLESSEDNTEVGTGLLTCGSGIMMYAYLSDSIAFFYGTGENFCIYQGAGAVQFDIVEDLAFVKFEGAVDIANIHFEE